MSSFWLTKKRKAELVDLCQRLGIQTDGYLKSDLEGMLSEYLDTHESQLSEDDAFAGYYDAQARSPQKNPGVIGVNPSVELATLPDKRSRRKTSRFTAGSSVDSHSYVALRSPASAGYATPPTSPSFRSGAESTPEPQTGVGSLMERKTRSGSRALATRTPRSVRQLREEAAAVPLPPSPAAVANSIEQHTNAFIESAKQSVELAEIQQKAVDLRDHFSNVVSVNAVSLTLEAILLLVAIIPVTYIITFPAVEALGIEDPTSFVLPDLFVLLTAAFWSPFLTWAMTSIGLPLLNSMLFNLVATSVGSSSTSQVDPLSFSVTKALITYLVHYKGFNFWGMFGEQTLEYVGTSVGKELQLIGAGIGGIAAIWEGILRR